MFGWQQIGNQKQVAFTHRIMKRIQIPPAIYPNQICLSWLALERDGVIKLP